MVGSVITVLPTKNVKFTGCPSCSSCAVRKRKEAGWLRGDSARQSYRWQPTHLKLIVIACITIAIFAVFAASGNGAGASWNNRGSNGNYWSASFNSSRNARNLNFNSGGVNPQNTNNRYNGFAVRAVQHLMILS